MDIDIKKIESLIKEKKFDLTFLEELDIEQLAHIIEESKIIDEYLGKFLPRKAYTLDEIKSSVLSDYAIIKGKIFQKEIEEDSSFTSSENLFFRELKGLHRITNEESLEYVRLYQECKMENNLEKMNHYRDLILEGNLPLVVSVAKRYKGLGLDFLELISEGSMGLMNSVDKFDLNEKVRFSTYAVCGIKSYIRRALSNQSTVVRKPEHFLTNVRVLKQQEEAFWREHGRMPKSEELASKIGWTKEKFDDVLRLNRDILSFDEPINEEESMFLGDLIPDLNNVGPEDYVLQNSRSEELNEYLGILTDKEKAIVCMHSGIGQEELTLEEIGNRFNITRERVRQIEARAFLKMKKYVKRVTSTSSQNGIKNNKYNNKYLKDILGIDEGEVYKISQSPSSMLLKQIFGPNLTMPAKFTDIDVSKRRVFERFIAEFNEKKKKSSCPFVGFSLSEITNIDYEYLLSYLHSLDGYDDKRYILTKYFGFKLDNRFKSKLYIESEVKKLGDIINEIVLTFNSKKAHFWDNKTLEEILCMPYEVVVYIYSFINSDSDTILYKAFGLDGKKRCNYSTLSKEEIYDLECALKMSVITIFNKEKYAEIDFNNLSYKLLLLLDNAPSFEEFFHQALNIIPSNVRLLLNLILGNFDGHSYSFEEISRMFCLPANEVNKLLIQGRYFVELVLEKGKIKYGNTFILPGYLELKRTKKNDYI